jgi:signal peptidase I
VVPEAAIEAASSGEGPGTATGAALAQAEQQPVPNSPSTQSEASQALERLGWMGSLQSLLTTVVIAVFAITFVVQAFRIPSESMQNTLLIGDYLLVDKAHFGPAGAWGWLLPYQKIRRGDIVVFRWPVDPKQHFVKRVIGTPGDQIRLVNKRVFVNGQLQLEPYVIHIKGNFISFRDNFPNGDFGFEHPDTKWVQQLLRFTEDGELIVPDGYFFVMGDNRDDSSDSRYWGFVPRENIVGRPLVIYWSMRGQDGGDTPDGKAQPDGKLTRFAVAVKQGWQDLRWSRMLTLVH